MFARMIVGWRAFTSMSGELTLLGPIGDVPPVELERFYRDTVEAPAMVAGLN